MNIFFCYIFIVISFSLRKSIHNSIIEKFSTIQMMEHYVAQRKLAWRNNYRVGRVHVESDLTSCSWHVVLESSLMMYFCNVPRYFNHIVTKDSRLYSPYALYEQALYEQADICPTISILWELFRFSVLVSFHVWVLPLWPISRHKSRFWIHVLSNKDIGGHEKLT